MNSEDFHICLEVTCLNIETTLDTNNRSSKHSPLVISQALSQLDIGTSILSIVKSPDEEGI